MIDRHFRNGPDHPRKGLGGTHSDSLGLVVVEYHQHQLLALIDVLDKAVLELFDENSEEIDRRLCLLGLVRYKVLLFLQFCPQTKVLIGLR